MEDVLKKVGLSRHCESFSKEKITPDIVGLLSLYDMKCLGVTDRTEIMHIRMECLTHGRERPMMRSTKEFDIPKEILQGLIDSNFSVRDMCKILSVSESTIYRKFRAYGLSKRTFDDIDDDCLDQQVQEVAAEFPRCGEEKLRQILSKKGIKVPRSRLRESLYRIDQDGIIDRKERRLTRTVYNVDGVNHLWHIDTNHKLIRWRFVIVGGIDGFSRFVTFLNCTDNNKATTILKCFTDGVNAHGLPLRVRSDKGLENMKVAEYMTTMRGPEGNPMITGKSTHNQRIERLWRDVFEGVLFFYYRLFHFMEDEGILDAMNDVHLYALHHVFLHKINEKLIIWKEAWNSHRIRTVGSSPQRLFTAARVNNLLPVPLTRNDANLYGVEGNIGEFDIGEDERPIFGEPSIPTTNQDELNEILNQHCPKDWTSSNYGIDIYLEALRRILL